MLSFVVASALVALISFALLHYGQPSHATYRTALRIGTLIWSKWLAFAAVLLVFSILSLNIINNNNDSNSYLNFTPLLTTMELFIIIFLCFLIFTHGAFLVCLGLIGYLSFRTLSQIAIFGNGNHIFFSICLLVSGLAYLALQADQLPWIKPRFDRRPFFEPSTLRKFTLFFLMLLSLFSLFKCSSQITLFLIYSQDVLNYAMPKYHAILLFAFIVLFWISIGIFGPNPPLLFALLIPSLIIWSFSNPFGNQFLIIPFTLLLTLTVSPQGYRRLPR
jgi:hypothetical protein